jgi:hypothetical protein
VIAEKKPAPFAGRAIVEKAKQESAARFGDPGHWPWLALYAELREEYIEGWLPDDLYSYVLIPYLNPPQYSYISTLKSVEHRFFPEANAEPLGVVVRGRFYDPSFRQESAADFFKRLEGECGDKELIVKEDSASSGKGLRFGRPKEIQALSFSPDRSYVIEPVFTQHAAMAEPYPESVNTIRISTFLDNNGDVKIKHRLLRVGSRGRRIVNSGSEDIDIYLNSVGNAISDAKDGIGFHAGEKHPDTGFRYRDLHVPSMEKAEAYCKKQHLSFPYLRFVGWDIYIDEQAEPGLIEWNAVKPNLWPHEAHVGPLWSEQEIRELVEC